MARLLLFDEPFGVVAQFTDRSSSTACAGMTHELIPAQIDERNYGPDSWLQCALGEGGNRQVQRKRAAVDLPTARLVRRSIGDWTLAKIAPAEYSGLLG